MLHLSKLFQVTDASEYTGNSNEIRKLKIENEYLRRKLEEQNQIVQVSSLVYDCIILSRGMSMRLAVYFKICNI
jgi:hypothetical protein